MSDPLLLYGATGYTGRIIAARLLERGLRPVLAGRNRGKLEALGRSLSLSHRVAALDDRAQLDRALHDIQVVLHAAGPFSRTAEPMFAACLRAHAHYLDVSAEVHVIEALAQRHADARAARIMAMPAVGFDVVPSDCLAAHVARRLPNADRLVIALTGLGLMTRASLNTLIEAWGGGVVRRGGVLTSIPLGSLTRSFDYGRGHQASLSVNWGDLATAFYTTGIPNIETYCSANPMLQSVVTASRYFGWAIGLSPWQRWLKMVADMIPEGPTEEQRAAIEMHIVAEAVRGSRRVSARLHTPEAYTFTGVTAAAIAQRALRGDLEPGFQTPARIYGPDFVLSFDGVRREDVE